MGDISAVVDVDVHLDAASWAAHLADETLQGLEAEPPSIPPVWFYDDRGSALFEEITRLPEYYLTNAERQILMRRAPEIAQRTNVSTVIELGSGTSDKTRLLLDAFTDRGTLSRFVPFDCSETTLRTAAAAIAAERPGLEVRAVVGDFHHHLHLLPRGGRRLVAFLGSTIGNLNPDQRARFLCAVRGSLDAGDWFLLGTDLVKDPERLIAAYDDSLGVTGEFNLNALAVMNRELDSDFDLDAYMHSAHWDAENRWIEMRLIARSDQVVCFGRFDAYDLVIPAGKWLLTEISSKFTAEQIRAELDLAGLNTEEQWTDPRGDFLVTLARA